MEGKLSSHTFHLHVFLYSYARLVLFLLVFYLYFLVKSVTYHTDSCLHLPCFQDPVFQFKFKSLQRLGRQLQTADSSCVGGADRQLPSDIFYFKPDVDCNTSTFHLSSSLFDWFEFFLCFFSSISIEIKNNDMDHFNDCYQMYSIGV